MRRREVRIELDGPCDELAELAICGPRPAVANGAGTQDEIKGGWVGPRMIKLPPAFDLRDVGGQRARDPTRDSVLKLEDIGDLAIEAISPHHRAASWLGQLR